MEPLKETLLDFRAYAKGGEGRLAPFSLLIAAPDFDEDRGYFCILVCPYFREKPFLIFGVDEAQACELSIAFIRQMLEGETELVDADGKPIDLPEIIWDKSA